MSTTTTVVDHSMSFFLIYLFAKMIIFILLTSLLLHLATSLELFDRSDSCPLGVVSCSAQAANLDTCCVPKYGLMVLVQQWDTGLGQSDQFTLHGLWPDTCTGGQTGDSGCDNSRIYTNISSIIEESDEAGLIDDMNMHWPSNKGDNNVFWSHEWSKHGTCVSTLNPRCYGSEYKRYRDVTDYFGTVLGLRKKYNLYKALSDKGIEPSNSAVYTADEFKQALHDGLGIEATIKCKSGRLQEIWTWFVVRDVAVYVPVNQTFASDTCKTSFAYAPKTEQQ